ncbi:MAG: DUF4238 domain-containing protein [Candidatus Shapirobacteria bacterium]|jgi:hypothetical protein
MTESKLPKKHHYVPQFYLKGFSMDKNNLWVCNKTSSNNQNIKKLTTKTIAFENNFYTYKSIDKSKETLEDLFCQMEGLASNVIKKISDRCEINEQEKADLSIFISFLWLRTPKSKTRMNSMTTNLHEKVSRMSIAMTPNENLKEFFKKRGKNLSNKEIDDLKEFAKDEKRSKFILHIPQNYWIKEMLQLGMDIAPAFQICDWEFCVSNKPYAFITSDNPFMLLPSKPIHPFDGLGLMTDGAKKIVPLNSKICLIMHEPSKNPLNTYREVDKNYFRMINEFTYKNAQRFVFSPDEGKLTKIHKLISKS